LCNAQHPAAIPPLSLHDALPIFERLNSNSNSRLPDLVAGLLNLAEIRPRVRVLGADGKRLPGVEVVVYENGSSELVAIFRNSQLDRKSTRLNSSHQINSYAVFCV